MNTSKTPEAVKVAVKMNEIDLVQFLGGIKGASALSFSSTTEVKLRVKDDNGKPNPYAKGQIQKRTRINAFLNVNYSNAVNNQRAREGKNADFQPSKRSWGESLKGLPFVVHTKKDGSQGCYLEVMALKCLEEPVYFDKETGKVVQKESIKPYMSKSKSRQGLDKEVTWRTFALSSIDNLKAKKTEIVPSF